MSLNISSEVRFWNCTYVEALVGPQRQPPGRSGGMAVDHIERRAPFGMATGLGENALHNQTRTVLPQRRRRENGPPDRFLTLLHR